MARYTKKDYESAIGALNREIQNYTMTPGAGVTWGYRAYRAYGHTGLYFQKPLESGVSLVFSGDTLTVATEKIWLMVETLRDSRRLSGWERD